MPVQVNFEMLQENSGGHRPAVLLSPLEVRVDPVKCVAVAVRVLELHAAGEA